MVRPRKPEAERRSRTIGVRAGPDRRTGLPNSLRLRARWSSRPPGRAESVPPTGTFGWDPFRPSPACVAMSGVDSRGRWNAGIGLADSPAGAVSPGGRMAGGQCGRDAGVVLQVIM